MRKYVYFAAVVVMFLAAQSTRADCPANAHVTIVFGNGIETTRTVAQNSLDNVLAPAILQALPPTVDQSCISFVLAYDSKFVDINNQLTSTANFISQLADASVQQGIDFAANFWSYWYSTLQPPTWFQNLQRQFITQTASIFQPDLLIHEAFYSAELALGHKVIVVAHSQGNLYVNQAYDAVTASDGNNLFHVVAVATPAIHVAGSGPYFTLHGDIILLALGLPPNITNDPPSPCPTSPILVSEACHSFDDSYMDAQKGDNTRPAIVNAVLSFLQATPKAFAFVANGSGVWSYTVDSTTGALTPVVNPSTGVPGFTTPGASPGSNSVAVDPAGKFVYTADLGFPASNGDVSGYRVDLATGVLMPVDGSPFSAGVGPISVVVHPTGKFLYVGNEISGDVSGDTIDPATGVLDPISGSPLPPHAISSSAVDPLGRFLYVAGGTIEAFKIDPNTGALTLVAGSPFSDSPTPRASAVAVDPGGKFVYTANVSGGVSAYTIDSNTGALTPIAGSPFPGALVGFSVAVDPSGKFVYVANANPSKSISAYTINSSTGALTAVVGSPFPTQGCPVSVAVDVSSKFVYAAEACGSNDILGYSIDRVTGALAPLANSPFPSGGGANSITIK